MGLGTRLFVSMNSWEQVMRMRLHMCPTSLRGLSFGSSMSLWIVDACKSFTFVEKNLKGATPWNVKKATYSYNSPEMATKRPIGSPPTNEITSPPTAKRRGNAATFDMVRPTNKQKTAAHFTTHTGGMYIKCHRAGYGKKFIFGTVTLGERLSILFPYYEYVTRYL